MDTTIVNLALPSIARTFSTGVSELQWVVDAYALVLAGLLMLSGSIADRVGRRRVFQVGLALFTLGSLLCSLAPGVGWLVAFRMVQAVGGSMLNPVAMSIIANTFVDPRERARAIGAWGAVVGLAMALGPVIGGALVDAVGWPSIFWINVPVGVAAIVLTALAVPESRAPRARRLDPVGQVLVIVLLASLCYAVIEAPRHGWSSALILGLFGVAVLSAVGFVVYERRRREPLLDPRFFRSAPFSGATVVAVCGFAGLGGFLFLNALYLQDVRGLSPLNAGLVTLPGALAIFAMAPLSGWLVATRGPRISLVASGVGLGLSGLMLTGLRADSDMGWLVLAYVVFGLGFGMINPAISDTAVAGMPRSQAGVASGVAAASRQVGASLGVAVFGTAVAGHVSANVVTDLPAASHLAWWILAGCGAVVAVVGFLTSSSWAQRTARRTSRLLEEPELALSGSRP
ncbi:DHA2 family efflux MFS transporter permease subunit [Actinomycetospora flava]